MKTTRILLQLSLIVLLALSCKRQDSGLLNIGTHSLYFETRGKGSPAVVIDVGLGESYNTWGPIMDTMSKTNKIFVYDRAGYGKSDPGPDPRDAATEATELHTLLHEAGIRPPYLLTGHSLGALNLQVFASLYPKEVAGLVLLDPSPKGWISGEGFPELYAMVGQVANDFRTLATQAEERGGDEGKRQAAFFRTLVVEQASMITLTAQQIKEINSFGDIPLRVIGSGVPNPRFGESAEAFQEYWISESRKLSALSTNGKFILAPESTHQIPVDAPELVISSIRELLGL